MTPPLPAARQHPSIKQARQHVATTDGSAFREPSAALILSLGWRALPFRLGRLVDILSHQYIV